MAKIKINSSQYSWFFGNQQIHFPYSIATLAAYSLKDENISSQVSFEKVFLQRDHLDENVEEASDADILLCSCYSWNWQITTRLAKQVKERNPECLIIFGGPEVPSSHTDFFDRHEYVDILVHAEGEITLHQILTHYLSDKDYTNVLGIETKDYKNDPQPRITDLDIIPSVYSTDLIWDLVERTPDIKYVATWETNRGCPYSCTFCDWGSATKSKVRNFSQEKLYDEVEWFGQNNIVYVDCADGNFGIFAQRDLELAERLAEVKTHTGYPTGINLTWIKASSKKVIPIAKVLNSVDLLRAISLSVQSLDDNTLKIIKRKNIRFNKFGDLVALFDSEGLQSYTELIMGLPGETYSTFKNNWETLASIYPMPTVMTWNCSIFVNAPMNDPIYREIHGINVIDSPMFMQHSSSKKKKILEYEMMVNGTASAPFEDLNKIYVYSWMMLVFHAFGVLEFVSRYYSRRGITYTSFYEILLEYCQTDPGVFGEQYRVAVKHAHSGYTGNGWDYIDPTLGDINFPLEEASWLKVVREGPTTVEKEIRKFISFADERLLEEPTEEKILDDLANFQTYILNFPTNPLDIKKGFDFDWLGFYLGGTDLREKSVTYSREAAVMQPDLIQWGYETAWFGRRRQRNKAKLKNILEI